MSVVGKSITPDRRKELEQKARKLAAKLTTKGETAYVAGGIAVDVILDWIDWYERSSANGTLPDVQGEQTS